MSTVNVKTISLEALSYEEDIFIDVRSPAEFEEYRLPHAINLPLFSNQERARVGTAYKQKSREEAIELGLSIYAPKWPVFFQKLKELQLAMPNKRMVIYCWRGGMRSRTIAGTLGLVGIECYQLEGGIRSFRRSVQENLASEALKKRDFLVIAGHTGTRKTEILHVLMEKGHPVLDLEGLAGHRGSVFGHIGVQPKSQKQFEYELITRLQELSDSPYVIIEAESKRIGHIVLPDFIIEGKKKGRRVELSYPFWSRVEHIYDTYQPHKYGEQIEEAIEKIRKHLSHDLNLELAHLREKRDYKLIFARLLEHYYDPKYAHAFSRYSTDAVVIDFEELDTAVSKLISYINQTYRDR